MSRALQPCTAIVLVLAAAPLGFAQTIVYVDEAQDGAPDGMTWETAFGTLQEALSATGDLSCCAGDGCEIWVAAGTYVPADEPEDREATFKLSNCVGVYGGFAGDETQRDQRDWVTHITTLSGDLAGDDIPDLVGGLGCFTIELIDAPPSCAKYDLDEDGDVDGADLGHLENSLHVVTASATTSTAILDGFTITAGSGDHTDGAGLFALVGSPTVKNCTFLANYDSRDGAGVYVEQGSPSFTDCTFAGNRSGFNRGGGTAGYEGSTLTFVRCSFIGNWANSGGAAYSEDSALDFLNCRFFGNQCTWSWGGAAVGRDSQISMVNCVLSGHRSNAGGALYSTGTVLTLINSTIVNNHIGELNHGGGIRQSNGHLIMNNCIVWGNEDSGGQDESAQVSLYKSTADVSHSCVQGCRGLCAGGAGNTGVFPNLADIDGADDIAGTPDDDLRPQFPSPCIDAGDNGLLPRDTFDLDGDGDTTEPLPHDVSGQARFFDDPLTPDGGVGRTPIVDMGAYEISDIPVTILSSSPPHGAIDARQPSGLDGSDPAGWQVVELTVSGDAARAAVEDFALETVGGDGPALAGIDIVGPVVRVELTEPLHPATCTTLRHLPSDTSVTLSYLPGDASGDGASAPLDILVLVDHLNGAVEPPLEIWQCDVNRSGICEALDILRLIDLLNGAGAYQSWSGVELPCP